MSRSAAAIIAAMMVLASPHAAAAVLRIHQVQGNTTASPYLGQVVTVEGIVTAIIDDGFFMQTDPSRVDADPATSEGLFVHTGTRPGGIVAVGNWLEATGQVEEYLAAPMQLPLTRLTGAPTFSLVGIEFETPEPTLMPSVAFAAGADIEVAERWEGMRVRVENFRSAGPSEGSFDPETGLGTTNGIFYMAPSSSTPGRIRESGIPILDPEPIPEGKSPPVWDMNAEILRVRSSAMGDRPVSLSAGVNFYSMTGILHYEAGRYTLLPERGGSTGDSSFAEKADGPVPRPDGSELTVAWVDLGGFWDRNDDPARDEPLVPETVEHQRLIKLNRLACLWLDGPDVLAVSGVESQEALARLAEAFDTYGFILDNCRASYQPLMVEGTAADGLDVGFLVRTRFDDARTGSVLESMQLASDATLQAPDGSTSPLFARPPLFVRTHVQGPYEGSEVELSILNVDIEKIAATFDFASAGSGWSNVRHEATERRRAQAAWLAQWLQARQQAFPDEALILLGGFEASVFSDGRVDVFGAITGREADAADVLWPVGVPIDRPLTSLQQFGSESVDATVVAEGSLSRLDHVLVSAPVLDQYGVWPMRRRLNHHAPITAVNSEFSIVSLASRDPVLVRLLAPQLLYADVEARNYQAPTDWTPKVHFTGGVQIFNQGPTNAYYVVAEILSNLGPGEYTVASTWPNWRCDPPEATSKGSRTLCFADYLTSRAELTFEIPPNPALEGRTATFTTTAHPSAEDPNPNNNTTTQSVSFSSATDLVLEMHPQNAVADPGDALAFSVGLRNASGKDAGQVTLTLDVSAPASRVRFHITNGTLPCTGSDFAQGSRWTCVLSPGTTAEFANAGLLVDTDPTDAGRVVSVQGSVVSTVADADPTSNTVAVQKQLSFKVHDPFEASTRVVHKGVPTPGITSSVWIGAFVQGTAPPDDPMHLRVTVNSALRPALVEMAPGDWSCQRSASIQDTFFDCTAPLPTVAEKWLELKIRPEFVQGNTDSLRITATYRHPEFTSEPDPANVGTVVLPVSGRRTFSDKAIAPPRMPTPPRGDAGPRKPAPPRGDAGPRDPAPPRGHAPPRSPESPSAPGPGPASRKTETRRSQ